MTRRHLEPLTPANVEAACSLRLLPEQRVYFEPVARSIAEAHGHPGPAWPRVVVDGRVVVGFVMAFLDVQWSDHDHPGPTRSGVWRLNIGADYQDRGHGTFAVEAVSDHLRDRGRDRWTYVTWEDGPHGPRPFWDRLGFEATGELAGTQTVGRRVL